jgi:hypothetical protein
MPTALQDFYDLLAPPLAANAVDQPVRPFGNLARQPALKLALKDLRFAPTVLYIFD